MAGIHKISSSLFVQSGSTAQFLNGINTTGSLVVNGTIASDNFNGISSNSTSTISSLLVGKKLEDGTFTEWVANVGELVNIETSGDFDTFCFVENNDEIIPPGTWKTVQKGPGNGLIGIPNYKRTYDAPGIYEYLIIASNKITKETVVKGTTVTIN